MKVYQSVISLIVSIVQLRGEKYAASIKQDVDERQLALEAPGMDSSSLT